MSPAHARIAACASRFPRVSGDEPVVLVSEGSQDKFSPRERG